MSNADYGLMAKNGASSSFNSPSPLFSDSISVNPYANMLFCPKFKWEVLPVFPTISKPKQAQGPTRAQILEW